jgi:hypothetical protein
MITAAVTLIGLAVKWQTDKRLMYDKEEQLKQLKLDAPCEQGNCSRQQAQAMRGQPQLPPDYLH